MIKMDPKLRALLATNRAAVVMRNMLLTLERARRGDRTQVMVFDAALLDLARRLGRPPQSLDEEKAWAQLALSQVPGFREDIEPAGAAGETEMGGHGHGQ